MTTCTCRDCNCSEEKAFDWSLFGPKDYDLEHLVGRRFWHSRRDVRPLLERATNWLTENDLCLLDIKYENNTEDGYSESIVVIAEKF